MASVIIESANDAIREFGNTNQEKKIELKRIVKEAEEVLPPATIKELRERAEAKALKTIHPKSRVLRNVVYATFALFIIIIPTIYALRQALPGPGDVAEVKPSPTPPIAQPTRTNPEASLEPTPQQTPVPEQPSPSPLVTESPRPTRPTPPAEKFIANATPVWTKLIYDIQWRVTGIQPQAKSTRFLIEIKNTDERRDGTFYSFDNAPLIVVDSGGNYYPMRSSSPAPADIREDDKRWVLQGGRVIRVVVEFAPLAEGSIYGSIKYKDNNRAEPAKFSLTQ